MTEDEYVAVANLTRLRIAREALYGISLDKDTLGPTLQLLHSVGRMLENEIEGMMDNAS